MSAAEERFIAGEGALAALIRAQPAFEPPPRMLGQILVALEAAPTPAGFEPPAALLDAVMAEAARLDTAQTPRRDALLAELAAGKSASDALGAPVSPATAAWLAQQQPTPASARPPRRRRWPWLAGFGTAVTAALAVSVALRVVQESAAPPPTPAALSKAAPAESSARTTDQAIAYAPKPQETAERLAKTEAPSIAASRARSSQRPEPEARRVAPAAPAAQPSMITETLHAAPAPTARPHAEADTDAPVTSISVPLDIPPATLAARLLARPAPAWSMIVAAEDETAGRALHRALVARLQTLGRSETVTLSIGGVAAGEVRLVHSTKPGRALQ